jgi:hypothetical protein
VRGRMLEDHPLLLIGSDLATISINFFISSA